MAWWSRPRFHRCHTALEGLADQLAKTSQSLSYARLVFDTARGLKLAHHADLRPHHPSPATRTTRSAHTSPLAGATTGPTEKPTAIAGPISSRLGPIELEALTAADDASFFDRIAGETKLTPWLPPAPAQSFRAHLERTPRVAVALLEVVRPRFRETTLKRTPFAASDTMARVAVRILELAERWYGEPSEQGIRIASPFSQEELAALTGASRAGVAHALQPMRELRLGAHCAPTHPRAGSRSASEARRVSTPSPRFAAYHQNQIAQCPELGVAPRTH